MKDTDRDSEVRAEDDDAPKTAIPDLQGFEFTFESSTLRFEVDVGFQIYGQSAIMGVQLTP